MHSRVEDELGLCLKEFLTLSKVRQLSPSPANIILEWSKFKAFKEDYFNVTQVVQYFFDGVKTF